MLRHFSIFDCIQQANTILFKYNIIIYKWFIYVKDLSNYCSKGACLKLKSKF